MDDMQRIRVAKTEAYDVVVCGGGTAGFCAAIAAGRSGAKTAVIERFGMLGGTMTVGGVPAPALFHAHGQQIIAGIGWELMTSLADHGYAKLPPPPYDLRHPQMAVELNAFQAAVFIDDMMEKAGVAVYFHQPVAHVCAENGHVSSVLIATNEGLARIEGNVFIDCTGDGNVAAMAGAEYEISDELQPASLNCWFANVHPARRDLPAIHQDFMARVASGEMKPHDIWGLNTDGLCNGRGRAYPLEDCYAVNPGNNLNHVYPFNGADNESRTRGEVEGRRSIVRTLRWMNEQVPGFERAYVTALSPLVSARESRRILGNAYIIRDAYVRGDCPPDSVCYSFYPIDIHRGTEDAPLDNEFMAKGRVPGIPYGALVARGFDNLMMAGRIISGDRGAQSAYRVQASCMATGEAAGTAAAMACKQNIGVDRVNVQALRKQLHENGVIVPDYGA